MSVLATNDLGVQLSHVYAKADRIVMVSGSHIWQFLMFTTMLSKVVLLIDW